MSSTLVRTAESEVIRAVRCARRAARRLSTLSHELRCQVLSTGTALMEERKAQILDANQKDCAAARIELDRGKISVAFYDRLQTSEIGIAHMIKQVREVAALPDPIGKTLSINELDDNLTLEKVTCPIGVIGIVFESRPDVIPQVVALALKSGNALLLKGGSEARHTNETLVAVWRESLEAVRGVPSEAINLLQTREDVTEMLKLDRDINLIIPRGSRDFVRNVAMQSSIPVLGHGEGICHVYVDRSANLQKAWDIVFDSKTDYPAACNSVETLLIHESVARDFLPEISESLRCAGVEIRGCEKTVAMVPNILQATEEDWETEYSSLIVSIKLVGDLGEALEHIDTYGSRHTECIVTEDPEAAAEFLQQVDAAGVYQNASTRFADGYRYGLGAELGISTGKLHARGPVGLEGLTTYKYKLKGDGQIVSDYNKGNRTFKHREIC